MATRKSDLAGSWYPGNASDCLQIIEAFSKERVPCPDVERRVVGGIVPHAGWFFSGRVAFSVISCLHGEGKPDTIILFGRHLAPGSPNYIMNEGAWETPLGTLEIDRELALGISEDFAFQVETPSRHEPDNTIELQLPFIKHVFPETMILPIGVPPSPVSLDIGERLGLLAGDLKRRVCVLGSTDLTHYGDSYGYAPKGRGSAAVDWVKNENDRKIIDLMVGMHGSEIIQESLKNRNACCGGAVAAAIACAKKIGAWEGHELAYTTSYDTRPDSNFVGYVGIVYS